MIDISKKWFVGVDSLEPEEKIWGEIRVPS